MIILLFMPIVKRKKKIFSPKMRKSGTCFAQMPLLRNYYYIYIRYILADYTLKLTA